MLPTVWDALKSGEERSAQANWPPADMHCPELPQPGNNFWSSSCRAKQLARDGACRHKNCPAGLALTGREKPEKREVVTGRIPAAFCECGETAMKPSALKRAKMGKAVCRSCYAAIIEVRKERRRLIREAAEEEMGRIGAEMMTRSHEI